MHGKAIKFDLRLQFYELITVNTEIFACIKYCKFVIFGRKVYLKLAEKHPISLMLKISLHKFL